LPTEAQWEYACRAGTTGEFAGEVDEMAWCARDHTGADNQMPWFGGSNKSGEHPVGRKKPNAWGFFDMQGNMSEWCLDRYAFKLPGGGVTNPAGPVSGEFRVKRGGNWMQSAEQCTSAARTGTSPIHRTTEGFRVALTLRRAELVAP
jgi:formylglycine-generating enzyme required for sulfatase activity